MQEHHLKYFIHTFMSRGQLRNHEENTWRHARGKINRELVHTRIRCSQWLHGHYPLVIAPIQKILLVPIMSVQSILATGTSITSWWKVMGNQLGTHGYTSAVHGHTTSRRQAIWCDEEACSPDALCPPWPPSGTTESWITHTSAHIKLKLNKTHDLWGT